MNLLDKIWSYLNKFQKQKGALGLVTGVFLIAMGGAMAGTGIMFMLAGFDATQTFWQAAYGTASWLYVFWNPVTFWAVQAFITLFGVALFTAGFGLFAKALTK